MGSSLRVASGRQSATAFLTRVSLMPFREQPNSLFAVAIEVHAFYDQLRSAALARTNPWEMPGVAVVVFSVLETHGCRGASGDLSTVTAACRLTAHSRGLVGGMAV